MRVWFIFVAVSLACTSANAQDRPLVVSSLETGKFVTECMKRDDLVWDPCVAYIMGVFDALSVSRAICPTLGDATTLQMVAVVRKYIRDNPESWNSSPLFLVKHPLSHAFPCRQRR